ncbi:uncharacterized protein BDFB_006587 [Asbolus verrucosus]|uniref:Uncharacterized protein n=1 Tax=Asbolus verrucosus TaxID=1661398 RepID=A0A482W0U4_ASBVE|nr:uncharacterized protein BDFB_006587 [Asbolus verrucosus]
MAWNLSRLCGRVPRTVSISKLTKVLAQFYSKFEVDVMDDFTSQLMQRKIDKWDLQKRKNDALIENVKVEEKEAQEVKIEGLGNEQLAFLLQDAMDNDDRELVVNLINLCVEHNRAPPFNILVNILSMCSQNGDKDSVYRIQKLCKDHYAGASKQNSDFQHFVAEAIWVKGDVSKALEIFEGIYRDNAYLRRRIRLMLKYLIADLVSNRSEAALWNIIKFSQRILADFQDFFPLTCVWQACFLSEWFTDQCTALELLEKNNGLCKYVVNRIPYVVFVSLKSHRTEVVYRLLEILLKYKMKQQYSSVVGSLLDYQFRYGDFQSCAEIIRWTIENDVALPSNQNIKMINLLLNEKMKTPLAPLQPKRDDKPKYNLKF